MNMKLHFVFEVRFQIEISATYTFEILNMYYVILKCMLLHGFLLIIEATERLAQKSTVLVTH